MLYPPWLHYPNDAEPSMTPWLHYSITQETSIKTIRGLNLQGGGGGGHFGNKGEGGGSSGTCIGGKNVFHPRLAGLYHVVLMMPLCRI